MGHFFSKNWYLYGSTFKFYGGTALPKPNLSTPPQQTLSYHPQKKIDVVRGHLRISNSENYSRMPAATDRHNYCSLIGSKWQPDRIGLQHIVWTIKLNQESAIFHNGSINYRWILVQNMKYFGEEQFFWKKLLSVHIPYEYLGEKSLVFLLENITLLVKEILSEMVKTAKRGSLLQECCICICTVT